MKKNLKMIGIMIIVLLMTGCSKLYTYDRVVKESKNKIASDIVVENPGSINRDNGLQSYTAYLSSNKYKKITIINGKDYLLPFGQNYLCTDFAESYLVPKFNDFKHKNNILNTITVESTTSSLHPRCKDLKITIDCNEKEKYFYIIHKFKEELNKEGIYLNETGVNRYDIYCQNGQKYNRN